MQKVTTKKTTACTQASFVAFLQRIYIETMREYVQVVGCVFGKVLYIVEADKYLVRLVAFYSNIARLSVCVCRMWQNRQKPNSYTKAVFQIGKKKFQFQKIAQSSVCIPTVRTDLFWKGGARPYVR